MGARGIDMSEPFGSDFLSSVVHEARSLKERADQAISQLDDTALFAVLDPDSNSVAILVKHLAGNLRSRWTAFLTSDGEKPDRQRDREFELEGSDRREALLERWETGWRTMLDTLTALGPEDLGRTVTIRNEPHTVVRAIHRAMAHTAYHVGQLVLLAKHARGREWRTLSIPRGGSEAFNARMREWHGKTPADGTPA
jgi:hypothetical protein